MMKKHILNLIFFLALAGIITSCNDDNDDPVYGEAKMTSFGFYAEDNAGILVSDYVVSEISADISILLPDYVDKSSLVARFEVTEDDSVTVGATGQISGVTANDFSLPVDYIVTEGTNNTKYTVTVGELPAAVWSKVTSDTIDLREFVLRVNPATNVPYIAYVQSATESANYKVGVFKLDEGKLVSVGPQTISEGRAAYCSMAFSTEGVPYVSFSDYTNTLSTSLSVMYLNGSNWEYVGGTAGKDITDAKITYNEVVVKSDGNPMGFSMNNAAGTLAKRELNISDYNGSAWTSSISMPGRLASQYSYYPKAKMVNGIIYLGVYNADNGTFSVYKNVEGTWSIIVDSFLDEGATTAYLRDFDMTVDAKGNVFIAIADDQAGADIYHPKVKKYDAQTSTWSTIGTPIDVNFSTTREFSLAVSPVGTPFLLYRNNSLFPEVVSFDNETQEWTAPVVLDNIESENLYMDFAADGVGYAAISSSTSNATILYKFDIPAE